MAERDIILNLRVKAEEKAMVEDLAEADGVSLSDAIRMAVRRAHAERFGTKARRSK